MKRPGRKHFHFFLFLTAFLVLLSGCAPVVRAEQATITQTVALETRQLVGQTMTANYDGLLGVEVFLDPKESAGSDGLVQLRLYPIADRSTVLAEAALPLSSVDRPGFYRFQFPPQGRSNHQDYYFSLELVGADRVELASAPGTRYLDGAMYVDGRPADSQLAFQMVYDPAQMALGLAVEALRWVASLLAAAFMAVLPGWALLSSLDKGWAARPWGSKLAFAVGLSLSIYPLLILWTHLVGLRLGQFIAWALPLAGAGFLLWKNRKARPGLPVLHWQSSVFWPDLVFVLALLAGFAARFWAVRLLDAGLWGDSYQHTMIAQLMVDHGGLFNSWQPYAELTTFTYHFAFHTWVAVYHWLTGQDVPQATLWMGQVINGLGVLAIYPLALRLAQGNRWAGAIAVLIAGLWMPVPMAYANWGRYTQLAGQVILPAAVCFLWEWLENKGKNRPLLAFNWIFWSALALAHYRVAVLGLLFLPAFFAVWPSGLGLRVRQAALVGAGAAALFLPWFIRVFGGKIMALFSVVASRPSQAALAEDPTAGAAVLFSFASSLLWVLALAAVLWGLWQRSRPVLAYFLWWALVFAAANPAWLGLPGEELITDFTVGIAAYILIGPLVGALAGQILSQGLDRAGMVLGRARFGAARLARIDCAPQMALSAVLVIAGLVGGAARTNDVDFDHYSLLTRPDLRAFDWIRQNTPAGSKFLVNTFLAFYNSVGAGSDGGWWLAFGTERGSTLPPMTQGFEQGPRPDYQNWNNQLVRLIQENGVGSGEVYQELKNRQVTHVYVAHLHGRNQPGELFHAEELLSSPNFQPVYHEDRVWVFEVQ